MRASEKAHPHADTAQIDGLVVARHGGCRHHDRRAIRRCGRGRVLLELRQRVGVHDELDVLGQRAVASRVVTVIGAHHVPLHRLRRERFDLVEHGLRGLHTALPIGHQHPVAPDHDQTDGRETGLSDLFVPIDLVAQLHEARELTERHAAHRRVGGADRRLGRQRGRGGGEQEKGGEAHVSARFWVLGERRTTRGHLGYAGRPRAVDAPLILRAVHASRPSR